MTFSPALVAEVMASNRKRLLDTIAVVQQAIETTKTNVAPERRNAA